MLRRHKGGVPTAKFLEALEVNRATFFRDIAELRDQMGQPIVFDRDLKGWRLEDGKGSEFPRDELPGVWLTPRETYALLTLYRVLRGIDPGFLKEYVSPLSGLLKRIIDSRMDSTAGFGRKVAIDLGYFEKSTPNVFAKVADALVRERRLNLLFRSEGGEILNREVSPQRVVLTASGWHLHVLDHEGSSIRIISLPAINTAKVLDRKAERLPEYEIDIASTLEKS